MIWIVSQFLGTTLEGKTLLLFTHRTSMLQLVDRVVVMDGGKVIGVLLVSLTADALKK